MTAYWNDPLFFQRAGASPTNRVVLHVEPDMGLRPAADERRQLDDRGRSRGLDWPE
jgi:hypothetical protein